MQHSAGASLPAGFAWAVVRPALWGRLLLAALGLAGLGYSAYLYALQVRHMGVLLIALLGVAALGYALLCGWWLGWVAAAAWRVRCWGWALVFLLLWLLSLALFFVRIASVEYVSSAEPATVESAHASAPPWLLVLGAGVPLGVPSPILAQRLDQALLLAQRYPQARLVLSGGYGLGPHPSEARVMANYLLARGLPAQRMLLEDQSQSTHQNLVFSNRLMQSLGWQADTPVCIVTSDFHTLRALKIAHKVGWTQAYTAAAPTPLYVRYASWLREYMAFISGFLLGEY